MQYKKLHDWNPSYNEAVAIQRKLASKVKIAPIRKKISLIAGLDCAFTKDKKQVIGCVVVLSWPRLELIESAHSILPSTFPYIPGLLSFREAPVCLDALSKLKTDPDILLIDGQGIAHPRRLGIASHIGLCIDVPTIGCAKSRLIGTFDTPPAERSSYSKLIDNNEIIGAVLRTRTNIKPLFISVGNRCTLEEAVKWTLSCAPKYRLPEPTRYAHNLVTKLKKDMYKNA